jgi:hypothetical protein
MDIKLGTVLLRWAQEQRIAEQEEHDRNGTGDIAGLLTGNNDPTDLRAPGTGMSFATLIQNRREELVESPPTRLQFKDFYRKFRAKEKESAHAAADFAHQCLERMPRKMHWRVYLEMADLSKRENHLGDARRLYGCVNQLQPFASQGWLEHSKLEEECGHLKRCQQLLRKGLNFCTMNEGLLTKAIKHEERMGNLEAARTLLGMLKALGTDKAWRTILEVSEPLLYIHLYYPLCYSIFMC